MKGSVKKKKYNWRFSRKSRIGRIRQTGGDGKNKLVVSLSNGLSNRIFQIMAGMTFAEKWNMDLYVLQSAGNHVSPEISQSNILQLFPSIKFIDDSTDFTSYTKVTEPQQFVYSDIPNPNNNALLFGYFQAYQYFSTNQFRYTNK